MTDIMISSSSYSSSSFFFHSFSTLDRLVGLVVKVFTSRAADLVFDSHLHRWDLSRSSQTSDLKTGTPKAALSGAWYCRVRAGTGWPDVSIP